MKVVIADSTGRKLGTIEINKVREHEDETADYSVRFMIDRMAAVGYHQRSILFFPRTKFNALALLRQALETLDYTELELENDAGSPDMARKKRGIGSSLPSEASDSVGDH